MIKTDHYPKSFNSYIVDGQFDRQTIESRPNKMVKVFLFARNNPAFAREKGIDIGQLQQRLLAREDLSDYHFLKLFCNCPDLNVPKEEVEKKMEAFLKEFKSDSSNEALLRRARKISRTVLKNPQLNASIGKYFHSLDSNVFKFDSLKNACYHALKSHIDGNTVLGLLCIALEDKRLDIIQACINYINSNFDIKLDYDSQTDKLALTIEDIDEKEWIVLRDLNPCIKSVTFKKPKGVEKLVAKKFCFSEAELFVLEDPISPQNFRVLGTFFPRARKCSLPPEFHENLKPEDVQNLSQMESLYICPSSTKPLSHSVFPKLKVCISIDRMERSCSFQEKNGVVFINTKRDPCYLDLRNFAHKNLITDELMHTLLHFPYTIWRGLTSVYLNDCIQLTDRTAFLIAAKKPKQLQFLNLSGCHKITHNGIEKLIVSFRNKANDLVMKLPLDGCQITDETFIEYLKSYWGFHPLNIDTKDTLSLKGCINLTDKSIEAICEYVARRKPPSLNLYLDGCKELTDKAAITIAHHPQLSKSLTTLSIEGCNKITVQARTLLNNCLKNLETPIPLPQPTAM